MQELGKGKFKREKIDETWKATLVKGEAIVVPQLGDLHDHELLFPFVILK